MARVMLVSRDPALIPSQSPHGFRLKFEIAQAINMPGLRDGEVWKFLSQFSVFQYSRNSPALTEHLVG
jgi:hypothetical protein